MLKRHRAVSSRLCLLAALFLLPAAWVQASPDDRGEPDFKPPWDSPPTPPSVLRSVSPSQWNEHSVRRVLQAFAFGGRASEEQIKSWASQAPQAAIRQMLNFDPVNERLSPAAPDQPIECTSLTELQTLWSSDDPANPVRVFDRPYYSLMYDDQMQLSPLGLFLVWGRAMHTPGCNQFLHKMAFYLTNYHASIHIQNAGVALIRDYYDDTVAALVSDSNFVDLMHQAAINGAVALAYGHMTNYVDPRDGVFYGNDDFAREYFQLLFGIEGTTEDEDYHEEVTIENNALLLTGMFLDMEPERFGSESRFDWFLSSIEFTDHVDATGRQIYNRSAHYDSAKAQESCLEILHERVCGATAADKLRALGPIAASHPESESSVPQKLVRFFGDTAITSQEAAELRAAWVKYGYDLLKFVRAYAVSEMFHSAETFKYWSAFERNIMIYNANILDGEESFARPFYTGPAVRMFEQSALPFAPIRDVFGGQTGNDAANDRYVFKNAWGANVNNPEVLAAIEEAYVQEPEGAPQLWQKDWSRVIPVNEQGDHVVGEVAEWLWNRFVADGGVNFDPVARAQVHALLATGFDFAAVVDRDNLDAIYNSADISDGPVADVNGELAATHMDFSDPIENERVGMAVNFISMLPFVFATTGGAE